MKGRGKKSRVLGRLYEHEGVVPKLQRCLELLFQLYLPCAPRPRPSLFYVSSLLLCAAGSGVTLLDEGVAEVGKGAEILAVADNAEEVPGTARLWVSAKDGILKGSRPLDVVAELLSRRLRRPARRETNRRRQRVVGDGDIQRLSFADASYL